MKKSTLALSIAAAIGGLGMAGNALAVTDILSGAAANSVMVRNDNGIGHQLVFPYFTAQNDNATLLTITNTDTTNGKLVKVRFRGAANSDDLFDFQVALSPGDVWTAAVTKDAVSGKAQLSTSDKSCTIPYSVNSTFNTNRVDPSAADLAAQTREGYVEVFNMANIAPVTAALNSSTYTTALYTAIKHVSGVAPCTAAILEAKLGTDATNTVLTTAQSDTGRGLSAPTTGLTGDWVILNQKTTASWSGSATALQVNTSATSGVATTGNVVFFPQIAGSPAIVGGASPTTTLISAVTADPLLTSKVVAVQNFDLPDMSTPYAASNGASTPVAITTGALQADATTAQLAVTSVTNQYMTDAGIAGVTDILFAQPTRRYSAAVNYKAVSATNATTGTVTYYPLSTLGTVAAALYRDAVATGSDPVTSVAYTNSTFPSSTASAGTGSAYYTSANLVFPTGNRNLCLSTIAAPSGNTIFDREETTPTSTTSTSFVISPSTVTTAAKVYVCGEAAVISINNGGTTGASALGASIARNDITSTSLTTYTNGWLQFATSGVTATGLPVLGQAFMRAMNGTTSYGFSYSNKVTR